MSEPAPPASKPEHVYAALRRAIVEQALLPGDKLPEDMIGRSFGVSRTIVRSAFKRLQTEGLLELRQNHGATVASPTLEEAADIFRVRRVLEREVMERLAAQAGRLDLSALEAHTDLEEAAARQGGADSIRLAGEFHVKLAALSGSEVLRQYVDGLVSRCSLILALYSRPHSADCAVREHRDIIAALRRGNAAAAQALMDTHLGDVAERALLQDGGRRGRDIGGILTAYAS
jgi:DNA-binding GntR family transcriptional regulator